MQYVIRFTGYEEPSEEIKKEMLKAAQSLFCQRSFHLNGALLVYVVSLMMERQQL
jgi:hypothetical protein